MSGKVKTRDAVAIETAIFDSVSEDRTVHIDVGGDADDRLVEYFCEHCEEWDYTKSQDAETSAPICEVWGKTNGGDDFRVVLQIAQW
jgi:hypothetical protein